MEETQVLNTQDTGEQANGGEGQVNESEFTALDYEGEHLITGVMENFMDDDDDDDEQEPVTPTEEVELQGEEQQELEEQPQEKQAQTPEQNAYFAEMRRQQQAAQREAEMRQALQNSPEYQISQLLQNQYNMPPEQILWQLQQAQLNQEAEARGVTPQQIQWERQQYQTMQAQQQLMETQQMAMQMQQFIDRMERESYQVLQQFPHLTPDDLSEAVIWGQMNNAVHLPLDVLVRTRHADKLYTVQQESARQEALAQVSGRVNNGVQPPKGKAQSSAKPLTSQEAYFAEKFGIKPEEYQKWK